MKCLVHLPLALLSLLVLAVDTHGQQVSDVLLVTDTLTVLDVADEMPEYPGGDAALFQYLSKVSAVQSSDYVHPQGRAVYAFDVYPNGSIQNVQVLRSSGCASHDKQMLQALRQMPTWKPAYHNGKAVAVRIRVPIYTCVR